MTTPSPAATTKPYNHAVLGGTFDHFHLGHKHFIDVALRSAKKIAIGLTTSQMLKDKFLAFSIEDYETRKKELINYLRTKNYYKRTVVIPLNDIYGPSLQEKNIDAIIITAAGVHNANIINEERGKISFPKLAIVTIRHIRGEDGKVISSGRIRAGLIDRNGKSYIKIFTDSKKLILADNLRGEVKNIPSGKLIRTDNDYKNAINGRFVIAVGDVVAARLIEVGRQADVSIIDFKSERQHVRKVFVKPTVETQNDPGTINRNAVLTLREALSKALSGGKPFDSVYTEGTRSTQGKQVIKVIGEEDLLTLPAILLAPLGSIVLYGMPSIGAVAVIVTEKKKDQIKRLTEKFTS